MHLLSTLLELYASIAIIYLIVLLIIAFQPTGHVSSTTIVNDITQALLWPVQAYHYLFKQ